MRQGMKAGRVPGVIVGSALLLWSCGEGPGTDFGHEDDDDDTSAVSGDVVIITEVMANPKGVSDSQGEWVEFYNPGTAAVDLEGWTLTDASGSEITFTGLSIAAKGYAVIGNNKKNESNGGVSVEFLYDSSFTLGNETESLSLADGSGTLVDAISYSKAYDGASISLDPRRYDVAQNDKADNFCATKYSKIDSGDYATPGSLNDACVISAAAGDLVITEIMANPLAVEDTRGEYIEIYNPTSATIKLDGWQIKDGSGDVHTISSAGQLEVKTKSYVVLGAHQETTENGGVKVNYSWGKEIVLKDLADTVSILAGTTVVDSVGYGSTGFPETPTGASLQLDSSSLTAVKNDSGAAWCASTETISGGSDKGTPGSANSACSAP